MWVTGDAPSAEQLWLGAAGRSELVGVGSTAEMDDEGREGTSEGDEATMARLTQTCSERRR